MNLSKAPTFSRIRVTDFGSVDYLDDPPTALDDVVTLWTRCVGLDDPFAPIEIRGVLSGNQGLVWVPDDAKVEVVEPPRYAGMPADLVKDATPVPTPAGARGVMKTAEGWPSLIWKSDILYSPVQGWSDPETAVEVILCALSVAPDEDNLRPLLLAALRAQYAKVTKRPDVYPPSQYPWRGGPEVGKPMLEYLAG